MSDPIWTPDSFVRMASDALGREFDSAAILAGVAEATATPPRDLYKNTFAMRISEDMAIAYGLIPDPRPPEVIEAERAEWARKTEVAIEETAAYVAALDAIGDPVARLVLDHHRRSGSGWSDGCEGCDPGSYAEDAPCWPCSTVELLADRFGIATPARVEFPRE